MQAWPVEVSEIALVGHSMGGLVARSASHAAEGSGAQTSDANRTLLIPRASREGLEITPFQARAPRWTHEDDPSK